MNHIYRIVFNRNQGIWQAVSENARGQGKGSRRTQNLALMAMALITVLTAICGTQPAWAAPSVTGTGDITPGSPTSPEWDLGGITGLSVGATGIGTLNIEDGGKVSNHNGTIGYGSGGIGTVTVSGGGSSWTNRHILYVGGDGTGTLNILDGGRVTNKSAIISYSEGIGTVTVSGTDSIWTSTENIHLGYYGAATINIGAASIFPGDATGAGKINAPSIIFGVTSGEHATGTINFNHTDSNYVFATSLNSYKTGTKDSLNHYAGTTLLTGDSSRFKGTTTVVGGTLVVGVGGVGKLGGALIVGNGATLQGTGSVGTTTLQSGAILAPGNSIGTLTVAGDLHFLPGSVFRVEANDQGQADKVIVTGTANLAGTVQLQADGAAFAPRTEYTILSAGALVSQFDAATINAGYEYLQPALTYTDKEVSLALVRKIAPEPEPEPGPEPEPTPEPTPAPGPNPEPALMQFHDAAVSNNQYATADGIESLPDTNPVYRQIETLPGGRAPQALDALSGELYASTQAALLAIADTPRERLFSHLRANFRSDTTTDAAKHIHPLWAEVSTRQLRLGNEAHIAQVRLNSTSLTVGADAALGKDWRAGAALHYDNGKIKVNDRSSQSDLESVGLTLGAGRTVALADGQLNLMAGASYAWHRLKSHRHTGESGLDQTLKASYNGNTSQVFGELGYALPLTLDSTLEPFAGLAWTRVHTKSFTESGGSAALTGQSQSTQTTASTLGLRTQVRLPIGSGQATLQASAGWRHAFGDVQPQAWLAFDGGQSFTVQGAPIARDAAVLGLGVAVNLSSNATLGMNYVGQFGNDGQRDNAGELKLRWAF